MRFIGQNAELQQLCRFLDRSPDTLAVMYRHRRVGKSELLRQALKHSGLQCVFFECHQTSEAQNLAAWQATIGLHFTNRRLRLHRKKEPLNSFSAERPTSRSCW